MAAVNARRRRLRALSGTCAQAVSTAQHHASACRSLLALLLILCALRLALQVAALQELHI